MKKLLVLGFALAMLASGSQLSALGPSSSKGLSAGTSALIAGGLGAVLVTAIVVGAVTTTSSSSSTANGH